MGGQGVNEELINPGKGALGLVGLFKPGDLTRFAEKTEPLKDCWNWTGFKDRKGYGKFWFRGVSWWAHRWSYAVFCGDIPEGETVNHLCRNPSCVNPNHLEVVSRRENSIHQHKKDEGVPF